MTTVKSVTQQTYDLIAPEYARANAQMPANVLAAAQKFREVVPEAGLCLDLGCGPGQDTVWFEQHGLDIFGADLSTGMLAQARKVTTRPLAQMDMLSLGFEDGVFSGIWCSAALLHLPKADAPLALREMRRILRKDGILDLAIQQGEGEGLEVNPYNSEGKRFFARYSLDEMSNLLARAGFTVFETETTSRGPRTWLRFVARPTK
jgi:ubiquinone/menaquinone biosynthesis C-methylase UbiE